MDLNAPLGLGPPPRRRRRFGLAAAGVAGAGILGLGAYYFASADPHGGEPYAVAAIPPAPAPKVPSAAPSPDSADPLPMGSTVANPGADRVRIEHGVRVLSPSALERTATSSPSPLVIDVSKALDARGRTPGSGFGTSQGAGTATRPPIATDNARPRIAILVGGLGLSEDATKTAIETLPAAVDLAFVPYGTNITTTVATAKAKGHEVLLQLPMQSAQGTVSGPHTLRTTETPADLAVDIKWLMSRFEGYAGVTNLLGAPVTANQAAMTGVLKAVASRGIPYIDDGTSRRSLAASVAAGMNAPAAQADVVLDATGNPAVVQANLERLMTMARAKGSAIGSANALSDHVGAIARFAGQLEARGFELVPVTALVRGGSHVAANR